jgi:hypothetical protein
MGKMGKEFKLPDLFPPFLTSDDSREGSCFSGRIKKSEVSTFK